MGYEDATFHFGVSYQPAVGNSSEIRLGRVRKLVLTIHPSHDLTERLKNIRIISRGKRMPEVAFYPIRKRIISSLQFLLNAVNTLYLPECCISNQAVPEFGSQIECIVTSGRLDKQICIKNIYL